MAGDIIKIDYSTELQALNTEQLNALIEELEKRINIIENRYRIITNEQQTFEYISLIKNLAYTRRELKKR